jgi:GNAT superfamily N-acetyltransferase
MDAKISMDLAQIRIGVLHSDCSIEKFRCGEDEIDEWARKKARKLHCDNRSRVFFAAEGASSAVLGLYSLSIAHEVAPHIEQKYRDIYKAGAPFVYINYLAVLRSCQRQGLGTYLLLNALSKAYFVAQHVAYYGVALRSLNDLTTVYYSRFGFRAPEDDKPHPLMILPVWTLYDLFGPKENASASADVQKCPPE